MAHYTRWVDFESRNLEALRLTLARRRSRGSRVDNGSGHPHAHRVAAACSSRVLAVPAALLQVTLDGRRHLQLLRVLIYDEGVTL
jgi:hypothetical protein